MTEEQILMALARNPQGIRNIPNPTEAMKLAAVSHKGTLLEYIKEPSQAVIDAALANDIRAIASLPNPTIELQLHAVRASWDNLRYIKSPFDEVVKEALSQSGWAIQYVENPSDPLQLEAVRQNYDALQYIKKPSQAVMIEAIKGSYLALRYMEDPSFEMESLAILEDIQAMRLISSITKEKALSLLGVSSRVWGYLPNNLGLTASDVVAVWIEKLSSSVVDERYIRELALDGRKRTIDDSPIDLGALLYQYGSLGAKRICMDVWLQA